MCLMYSYLLVADAIGKNKGLVLAGGHQPVNDSGQANRQQDKRKTLLFKLPGNCIFISNDTIDAAAKI